MSDAPIILLCCEPVSSRSDSAKPPEISEYFDTTQAIAQISAHVRSKTDLRKKIPKRRQPKQGRAQETVEAVLDAVVKILKRESVDAVTTNRIAQVAGVSVGSVYQYFPDKRAIFLALHERHVEEVIYLLESTLIEHSASPLENFFSAVLEVMIDAHAKAPELHELLLAEVPHRLDGARQFDDRLCNAFRLAISSKSHERIPLRDMEKTLFIVLQMVEALSHGAVLRRPPSLSLAAATEEAVQAILAYLRI